jgi:hypothetical protein
VVHRLLLVTALLLACGRALVLVAQRRGRQPQGLAVLLPHLTGHHRLAPGCQLLRPLQAQPPRIADGGTPREQRPAPLPAPRDAAHGPHWHVPRAEGGAH